MQPGVQHEWRKNYINQLKKEPLYCRAVLTFRGCDGIHEIWIPNKSELFLFPFKTQTCLDLQFTHDSLYGKIYEYVRNAWAHSFEDGEVKIN